jgi:hypothetical protein
MGKKIEMTEDEFKKNRSYPQMQQEICQLTP